MSTIPSARRHGGALTGIGGGYSWLQPHHVIESYVDRVSRFHKTFTGRMCDNSQLPPLLAQLQGSKDRLDLRTYEVELLGAFARTPTVVEKLNRHFVPFFLALEQLCTCVCCQNRTASSPSTVSCLLTYKSPALRHREEQLRAMLDETK
jgi:hypothetical protein